MGQVIFKFIVGGLAGLIAWGLVEPTKPGGAAIGGPEWQAFEDHMILLLGLLVGLALGAVDGFSRGGKIHFLRGLVLGGVFGAIGATLGYGVGGKLSSAMFPGVLDSGTGGATIILARIVAITPIGLFLGAGIGASSLNLKKFLQGLIGGALGAGIGAACFDLIGSIVGQAVLSAEQLSHGEVGGPSRAILLTVMGAAIGIFIGLVELMSRSAWLRLELGRNEGKEWSIDAAQTFIGRSESAQVPLFGDPSVAPMHACITKTGGRYYIADGGSGQGTFVNGMPIQQAPLNPGDQIRVGGFALMFLVKNMRAPVRPPEMYGGYAQPISHPGFPQQPAAMAPQAMPGQPTVAMTGSEPATPAASQPTMAYPAATGQQAVQTRGWTLVALDGSLAGQRFPLAGPTEIGRECPGITMSGDAAASRRHASVVPDIAGVTATDLGSTNGMYVNGQRVPTGRLVAGDMLKIGSTTFRLEG